VEIEVRMVPVSFALLVVRSNIKNVLDTAGKIRVTAGVVHYTAIPK
jgi:hypothetical protein